MPGMETRPMETFVPMVDLHTEDAGVVERGQNRRALVPGTGTGPN